jgi:dCMP deaminase
MMAMAAAMADRSTCSSKHRVGAVIAKDDRVLATGFNGAPSGLPHCDDTNCELDLLGRCIRAVHAELNAIIQCAIYGVSTKGAVIYTTLAPCRACANAIIQAGIIRVEYGDTSSGSALNFLISSGIDVYSVKDNFHMMNLRSDPGKSFTSGKVL